MVEAHSFVANLATIEPAGHPWSRWFLIEFGHPLQMAQQTAKKQIPICSLKGFEQKLLSTSLKNTTGLKGFFVFFSIFSNMRTLNGKAFSLDHLLGVSRLQVQFVHGSLRLPSAPMPGSPRKWLALLGVL